MNINHFRFANIFIFVLQRNTAAKKPVAIVPAETANERNILVKKRENCLISGIRYSR